jgi:ParB-like chromosome segregation protein Spo0J
MQTQDINIDAIFSNPYQPRTTEDLEHLEKIARSIAADWILQPPVVRPRKNRGDEYELAFGHTRHKAFVWLSEKPEEWFRENGFQTGPSAFLNMPCDVRVLTDEVMYRHAVSENSQRKDLNTIEEARAMKRAMDEFKYTSRQVGELFGKSEVTVRGLVRLLDLPDEAQAKIATGEISQGVARSLLTVAPLMKAKDLGALATDFAKNPGRSMDTVNWELKCALRNKAKAVEMGPSSAGAGLWPLDWTFEQDSLLERQLVAGWKGAKKIEQKVMNNVVVWPIADAFREILQCGRLRGWEWTVNDWCPTGWNDAVAYVHQMISPSTCDSCPFHTKFSGTHYCGMKPCYDHKLLVWSEKALHEFSQATGIAIYNPDVDGEDVTRLTEAWTYGSGPDSDARRAWNEAQQARYAAADPTLRLQWVNTGYSVSWLTKHERICVLDVSPEARAKAVDEKQGKLEANKRADNASAEKELSQKRYEQSKAFLATETLPFFAQAVSKLESIGFMLDLLKHHALNFDDDAPRAEKLRFLREHLAYMALNNAIPYMLHNEGPLALAKHLEGVAKTWGVTLPDNWMERAANYEPGAVSVEMPALHEVDA